MASSRARRCRSCGSPYPSIPARTFRPTRSSVRPCKPFLMIWPQVEKTLGKMQGKDVKIRFDLEKVRLDFRSTPGSCTQPRSGGTGNAHVGRPRHKSADRPGNRVRQARWSLSRLPSIARTRSRCRVIATCFRPGWSSPLPMTGTKPLPERLACFIRAFKLPGEFIPPRPGGFVDNGMADGLAFIHEIRWQPVEPGRLSKAREHLKQVVALSRLSWQAIFAETDDDQESIPAPAQKNAVIADHANHPAARRYLACGAGRIRCRSRRTQADTALAVCRKASICGECWKNRVCSIWFCGQRAMRRSPILRKDRCSVPTTWRTWENVFGGNFLMFAVYLN